MPARWGKQAAADLFGFSLLRSSQSMKLLSREGGLQGAAQAEAAEAALATLSRPRSTTTLTLKDLEGGRVLPSNMATGSQAFG